MRNSLSTFASRSYFNPLSGALLTSCLESILTIGSSGYAQMVTTDTTPSRLVTKVPTLPLTSESALNFFMA